MIPAYNEENNIEKIVELTISSLKEFDYEIVVVDDGSKDRTVEILKELMKKHHMIRMIQHKSNKGYADALRTGFNSSNGKYITFIDADLQNHPADIPKLLKWVDRGYDIVIGSRDIKGAVIANPQSWIRRRLGDAFNLLVQIILGLWGIWDTQCGFKGFTKEAAKNIFEKCKVSHFAFDPEILVLGKKLGYKIKEIPIVWINAPDSKVKVKSIIKMAIDLLKIRLNLIIGKYD